MSFHPDGEGLRFEQVASFVVFSPVPQCAENLKRKFRKVSCFEDVYLFLLCMKHLKELPPPGRHRNMGL
jgi:hypothetical protein